jgi:NAD(P)-dependent dehydrogenase (short-subunit alcohol dehydrogenase family)
MLDNKVKICFLTAELPGTAILVNSVDPGWVATDMQHPVDCKIVN